jgi:hypothetical protein
MRLYPSAPAQLRATLARDLLVLVLLVLFAVLALDVHDAVDELAAIPRGVETTGGSVRDAMHSAADGVGSLPVVGGQLGDALREAGDGATAKAVAAGQEGQERVHELARTLGWLTFVIPSILLLAGYLPTRIAHIRGLTAAARSLDTAHPRVLAMRAAFSLPYADLLRHTADPFGDLEAERYDALAAAALEDAGLRAPAGR